MDEEYDNIAVQEQSTDMIGRRCDKKTRKIHKETARVVHKQKRWIRPAHLTQMKQSDAGLHSTVTEAEAMVVLSMIGQRWLVHKTYS